MASKSVTNAPSDAAFDLDDAYSAALMTEQDARRIAGIATGIRATVESLRKLLPLTERVTAPGDDALAVLDMADTIRDLAFDAMIRGKKQAKLLGSALDAREGMEPSAP